MPNSPHNVDLRIDASNRYSFSGGSEGSGNCRNDVGQGAAPVQITLEAPDGYRIRAMSDSTPGVQLTGTGTEQMRPTVSGQGQSANIVNSCVAPANVDYTVNVETPDGGNIACHPRIVNR
jgi:hypothetical protein